MAMVASSSDYSLHLSSNPYDWPRLNEQFINHETKSQFVTLQRNDNLFQPSADRGDASSHTCSNTCNNNLSTSISRSLRHRPSVRKDVDIGIHRCSAAELSHSSSIYQTADFDVPQLTYVSKSISQQVPFTFFNHSPKHNQISEQYQLSDPKHIVMAQSSASSCSIDSSAKKNTASAHECENKSSPPKSFWARKKKRNQKIRVKSLRKWKPYDSYDLGFHVSRMPYFLCEAANDVTCECLIDADSMRPNIPELGKSVSGNITQNDDVDDISFFHALGINVLDCDDDFNDFLDWDGVNFAKKKCPPPSKQISKSEATLNKKCKFSKKTPTQLSKTVSAKSETFNENEATQFVLSPSVIFQRFKKCDSFKLFELECKSSTKIYIRRDRDHRIQKVHKAVKSKNCRSLFNNRGRKRMYMHHRLVKMHSLDLEFRGSLKSYRLPPMSKRNITHISDKHNQANQKVTNTERSAPVQNLKFALHDTTNPGHLETDLASFLMSLQHRDLTPEDYDMLLRLDDTVKAKTASDKFLRSLRTEKIGLNTFEQNLEDTQILCAICMEPYIVGQERKFLPCNHDFHTSCIDMWLKNSSLNCPLDSLPVEPL